MIYKVAPASKIKPFKPICMMVKHLSYLKNVQYVYL